MFPVLCGSLISLFSGSQGITLALGLAGCVFAFLGARAVPGKPAGPLVRLSQRASQLLQHLQSLGMPALAPMIRELAQGNLASLPASVHSLLDQLDDKDQRAGILDTLFYAQLNRHVTDPERRAALLAELKKRGIEDIP
jgi:hypothetical protein